MSKVNPVFYSFVSLILHNSSAVTQIRLLPSFTMPQSPVNQSGHFVHNSTTAPEHPSLLGLFSLKGKTAIITGSGAGIGLAVAQGLAEAGANVALWWSTNDQCPKRAEEIAQKYGVQGMQSPTFSHWPLSKLQWANLIETISQGLPGEHHQRHGR